MAQMKSIIGDLTIANELLKKSTEEGYKEWKKDIKQQKIGKR